jgi:hypothetical protein
MLSICVDHNATTNELADTVAGGRGDHRIARSSHDRHLGETELGQCFARKLYMTRRTRRVEGEIRIESGWMTAVVRGPRRQVCCRLSLVTDSGLRRPAMLLAPGAGDQLTSRASGARRP